MAKKFYITSAIPYVNAAPHIGHALEFVQTDVIGRYHRLLGDDVLQLSGGDENALKNVQAAQKANKPVQEFIDENNNKFHELTKRLNCQYDVWQKGSNIETHFPSSQKLWDLCDKAGDIYKKSYEGLYCVGCETFYDPDELNELGECFEHPGKKVEKVSEENYFFRLSKYQEKIIELITTDTLKITPEFRKNEVLSFLKKPLVDISISRSNERAKNWGVPVPNDSTQRMYVWFDALNIYQSGVGFGSNDAQYKKWWPADVHVIGKGITRFHAVYWPAFLLSAGLPLPKSLFVHEYFTVNGQKMSKTLGNVIDPNELITKYGADALRYYFLAKFSPFSDGNFSEEEFKKVYNADLANGLGNLISRVAKLAEGLTITKRQFIFPIPEDNKFIQAMEDFRLNDAVSEIWHDVKTCDQYVNEKKLWTLKDNDLLDAIIVSIDAIRTIATQLLPFMPQTGQKILDQFSGEKITAGSPLFPRLT